MEQRLLQSKQSKARSTSESDDTATVEMDELIRLQRQVARAVDEIKRLRKQNKVLAERLRKLEEDPGAFTDTAVVPFDQNSEELRQHITRFIEAIDRHLEQPDHKVIDDS